MNGIHEFVIRGGQTVTAGQMDAFRRKLPFLKVKAEIIDEPELPHLRPQTNFLVRYAEDVLDGAYPCSDLQAIAETVFALSYLLKEVDIMSRFGAPLGACRRFGGSARSSDGTQKRVSRFRKEM